MLTAHECGCNQNCQIWEARNPDGTLNKDFNGNCSEWNCKAYVEYINNKEKTMAMVKPTIVTAQIPAPVSGEWEKEYEWTGEFRAPKEGEWFLSNDRNNPINDNEGLKTNVVYSYRYILKPKAPKWIPGKAYAGPHGCWGIRTKDGNWLTGTGMRGMLNDDNMTENLVPDVAILDEMTKEIHKNGLLGQIVLKLIRKNWEDIANM